MYCCRSTLHEARKHVPNLNTSIRHDSFLSTKMVVMDCQVSLHHFETSFAVPLQLIRCQSLLGSTISWRPFNVFSWLKMACLRACCLEKNSTHVGSCFVAWIIYFCCGTCHEYYCSSRGIRQKKCKDSKTEHC